MDQAIRLPVLDSNRKFTVVASKSHMSPKISEFIVELKKKHGYINLITTGSSLKLREITEGSADVYPRFAPISEWNTAAAHAVVIFSGGEVYQANTDQSLQNNKEDILNPWFVVKRGYTSSVIVFGVLRLQKCGFNDKLF